MIDNTEINDFKNVILQRLRLGRDRKQDDFELLKSVEEIMRLVDRYKEKLWISMEGDNDLPQQKYILLCSEHIQFTQHGKTHKSIGEVSIDEVDITSEGLAICSLHQSKDVYYRMIVLDPQIVHIEGDKNV